MYRFQAINTGDQGDYFDGRDGPDVLRGGSGFDTLIGGKGVDVIDSGPVADGDTSVISVNAGENGFAEIPQGTQLRWPIFGLFPAGSLKMVDTTQVRDAVEP